MDLTYYIIQEKAKNVLEAMKSLKNDKLKEVYPIGLIDISLWEWPQGVGLYGMYQMQQIYKDEHTLQYLINWYRDRIREGLPERNVNTTSPMLTLIHLCEQIEEPEFEALCQDWAEWVMNSLIRTGDGMFQHMITGDPNDGQVLIDTLFMTVLFLAKAGKYFDRPDYIEEAIKQVLLHVKYLHENKSGLFYHGWDFNGCHHYGEVFWGRGNGWYTTGVVEFLDIVDVGNGLKQYLLAVLNNQIRALSRLQDENGMWHTVLDDKTSYHETSATAAFGYGILKGIRKGYVDSCYYQCALKALEAVVQNIDEHGIVQNVSYGTPVGNSRQFYKEIPISPMTYGQALTLLFLIEGLKHFRAQPNFK